MVAASTLRRFTSAPATGHGVTISALHPAYRSGRTIFPSRVFDPDEVERLLKDGHQQRKLGKIVQKGPRRGWPIFSLTLEERATCPRTCKAWGFCFDPATQVLCADLAWRRIDQLAAGDSIVGFDEEPAPGKDRLFRYATVEALREVSKPRVVVRTIRGTITVTGDHLFLARRKQSTIAGRKGWQWLRADSLGGTDQILFLSEPWEQDFSYDAGRVRGFVEGEGTVSLRSENGFRKSRLSYAQLPGPLFDQITDAFERLGFRIARRQVISGVVGSRVAHGDLVGGWREVLRFLGRIRPTRLLANAEGLLEGHSVAGRGSVQADVLSVSEAGEGPVYEIATSTRTLVANGFLAHNCYGNNSHAAERITAGDVTMAVLWDELADLETEHPGGFMVRLHILGDFFSEVYVDFWRQALDAFPALHVFGFTARDPHEDPIGEALFDLAMANWDRFAIRFSGAAGELWASRIGDDDPDAITCPAQTDETGQRCCATCALCWQSQRSIAFRRH